MLVVKSKVKEYVKSLGDYQVSGDFVDALNEKVGYLIQYATKRTAANARKTVSAKDV